jgi:hypothetical protein
VDLGVDAGGITRNIARGISTSGILTEEQKERDWHWICRSFVKKGSDEVIEPLWLAAAASL